MTGILCASIIGNPFLATIGPGQDVGGTTGTRTFSPNTAGHQGGVGPFTYLWSKVDDGLGFTWNIANGATVTATLSVGGTTTGDSSSCTLYCTITDTATGASVTSAGAFYQYFNNSIGNPK